MKAATAIGIGIASAAIIVAEPSERRTRLRAGALNATVAV